MKILIISDTHNKHRLLSNLPEADIIIHCGDITGNGGSEKIKEFMAWFSPLEQFKYKIFVAGNHDWLFERDNLRARKLVPKNIIYLEDEEIIIDGIKFYGTPVQKHFCNWAFNRDESILAQHWAKIPNDTDILITHSPPYGIGDNVPRYGCQGSPSLYKEIVERIRPLVSAYGHIHEGYCIKVLDNITFINASNLNGSYQCVNDPILIEIIDRKVNIINN